MAADPDIRSTESIPRPTTGNVRVSHSSHDGAIAVVVSLDGHVRDLRLTPAATQRPADQLAQDILDCIHAAQGLFPTPDA
ncbi:YbaB/EbfC family nucleoid-associated protein [Amycolatopsis nalaikhensis]|uniref:YbaB/EbfC family nucleoid-associated protein n=1 Tax=Amycolatopsis nalaikhensis TaxID=715472 RepID=A0ABY8XUZ0_9PSEU|nr:YbaB/EbfC family nucleoid-associated protein [Amycolatopsis sp. 2-2]WIV59245.1 YbaB/EbfC family nucleoid-associated protein [Amycolatopsis sp. 2-2]